MGWVGVESDDAPPGCDAVAQELEDPARAAAEIDSTLARLQAHAIEQGGAEGAKLVGLAS
jgi:hypothetical protein